MRHAAIHRTLLFVLAAMIAGLLPALAAAVVVPGSLEFTEGADNNCFPLTGCQNRDRYQQVYDSSEFGGPIRITELRFRHDDLFPTPFSSSFSDVTIGLSTTSAAPDALSTTFADNQDADFTIVYSGALTLSSSASSGSPTAFDISIVLDQPFVYDPSQGNLLFEWRNAGGESFGGISYDAVQVGADPVSRLYATDPNAISGLADTTGLVTQFVGGPPIPASDVVPAIREFSEGNFHNCIPPTGCQSQDRYQQVYNSAEFAGPIRITELHFRRDGINGPNPFSVSFSDVEIGLSTTSASADGLSTTFATNQGADFTVVHSGSLTVSSPSSGGSPAPFDVSVRLEQPFVYDPSQGNLLLDWTNFGSEGIESDFLDAESASGDSVSRVFASSAVAATGTTDTVGLVTQFRSVPLAPVYSENFEGGLGGFAIYNDAGAGNGLWHRTTACNAPLPGHSLVTSLYYGQDGSCDYDNGVANEGVVTSPAIFVLDRAQLAFNYFLQTEGTPSSYDMATVQVSVNGGPFQLVASNDTGAGVGVLLDPSGAWVGATVDLSSLLPPGRSAIHVRFSFDTVDSSFNTTAGFYVDDVVISTFPFYVLEDFAAGDPLLGFDRDPNGLWHPTTVCEDPTIPGHSIAGSLYYGQDGSCNYSNGVANAGIATSAPIPVLGGAALTFNYFLETEQGAPSFDLADVLVSVDGGLFQLVASNDVGAGVEVLLDGTGAWERFAVDLDPLLPDPNAVSAVEVRFAFDTGDDIANNFAGFYVDDFAIGLPEPGMGLQLGAGLVFLMGLTRQRRRRTKG